MSRKIIDTKIRTLIKEIAEFVNNGDFGLNQYSLHPTRVSNMINSAKYYKSHILSEINIEKINGRNHFWVE